MAFNASAYADYLLGKLDPDSKEYKEFEREHAEWVKDAKDENPGPSVITEANIVKKWPWKNVTNLDELKGKISDWPGDDDDARINNFITGPLGHLIPLYIRHQLAQEGWDMSQMQAEP